MDRTRLHLTLTVLLGLAAAGCRVVSAPSAAVVPSVIAASAPQPSWLESATLVYLPTSPSSSSSSPAGSVAPASFSADTTAAIATVAPHTGLVRVLAVRYPHPDGRRDVARAELVVADPAAEARAKSSWRSRLAGTMTSVLPGVAWGPGIQQAVGLDVPVSELQAIIAATQPPAPVESAPGTAAPVTRLEVNGKRVAVASLTPPQLTALVERVARDGRAITYRGSASDLLTAGSF